MTRELAVEAADDARIAALKHYDGEALQNLLAEDLIYTHSTGRRENKEQYIDRISSKRTPYAAIEVLERKVAIHGQYAVARGRQRSSIHRDNTIRVYDSWFTSIWTKSEAGWQLSSWQGTTVQTP